MSVFRAIAFSYLDKYATLVVNIASSLVLARLLTPTEIGIYSVTAVLIGLAGALRDLGAGTYLMQERELTPAKIRATSAVALGMGVGFACLLYAMSGAIARFYSEPGVEQVMQVLALNFAITPIGSVVLGLLARNMRFGAIAVVNLIASITNATVAIALAYGGHGYMSLAWASLAAALVGAVVINLFRPAGTPWLPSPRGARDVVSFGGKASVQSIIDQVFAGMPDLVIGRVQGFEAAGLYGRADSFVALYRNSVMRALWPVMLPYFSKQQRDHADVRSQYLRAIMLLTAIGWPFLLFMAVMTYPLMLVLYGSQWLPAVDAARVLCVAGALHVLGAFAAQVMIAIGRIDHLLKVQVSLLPVKLALVLTGAWFGLEMLAVALLAWAVVAMMVYGRMVMRALDFRLREFLSIATKSGFVAAVTIAPALAVVTVLGWQPDSPVAVLLISLGACGVAYIGAIWLIRHPLLEQIGAAVIWLKRSVPE